MSRFTTLLAVLLCALITTGCKPSTTVHGAGATFPDPIYSQWGRSYYELNGTQVNFQPIGSGGGIEQIQGKTVDFGATDAPLKHEELEKSGLVQFPMVVGGVVPVVHLKGIESGKLKLSGPVLADIYLGKITEWNDPAMKELNPDLDLPAQKITVVSRADGSGTTWIFTNYLAAVSPEWKDGPGVDKSVKWPVGVGGKGNAGVASNVSQTPGSIGYVELAYAINNKMDVAQLQNRDGQFVMPTIEAFQSAAANADWKNAAGYYVVLVDQPGDKTWPISGATFILIHKQQKDAATAKTMLQYFDWCYRHGGDAARGLHYVPLPPNVYEMVEATWKSEVTADGKSIEL